MKKIILSAALGLALACVVTKSWGANTYQKGQKTKADHLLFLAAATNNVDNIAIATSLKPHKAQVDDRYKGGNALLEKNALAVVDDTALHIAARAGSVDAVNTLLGMEANPLLKNGENKKPSDVAKTDALKELLLTQEAAWTERENDYED